MTSRPLRYQPGLAITADAAHHHLVVVDLLGPGDLKTATKIAQHAANQAARTSGATAYSRYVKIHNRPMFDKFLDFLAEQVSEDNNPLILFDAHGCRERGLFIASTNTYVPWSEVQAGLGRINRQSRNGTGVIMSSCYGMAVCDRIQITEPAPFQFCIAPTKEVQAVIVETQMQLFIETMLEKNSMDIAIKHLTPHYDFFHSHQYFYNNFLGYLRKHGYGSGRKKLADELTTRILSAQPEKDGNLQTARQIARASMKENHAYFTRLSDIFLYGKNCLSFEQLEEYARKWPQSS